MNDIANLSLEFIVWILRVALVGMIYLFVWRIFRTMIRGDQNMPVFVGTNAFLILQRPGATLLPRNKVYEIYDNSVLGRKSDCAVILNDPLISDHHAIITKQHTVWRLRDLGSTNKTYINGLQVNSETALTDGDIIAIGRVELRLHLVERSK